MLYCGLHNIVNQYLCAHSNMTNIQLAIQLDQLVQAGPTVFIKLNPEIVDFTKDSFSTTIIIAGRNDELKIKIDKENLVEIVTFIKTAILEEDITIIGWNLKNLFTMVLAATGAHLEFTSKLLDLKLGEAFIGIRSKPPESFSEMVTRLKVLLADSSWNKFRNIYQKIYLPLQTRVIPGIEVEGVLDDAQRKLLFPYYEIEGQINGRMVCQLAYNNSFNPHSLMPAQRPHLRPKDNELSFLWFDYHFHEVCMLAWLSKDQLLLEMLSGDNDFYLALYSLLTGTEGDTDKARSFCKDRLFLPTVYGQSAKTLAETTGIGVDKCEKLLERLKKLFSGLFGWVENHQGENLVYTDYIGRKRHFSKEDEYKYRNFIIQSPGAMFCLDKLVQLYNEIKEYGRIAAHIHDGYLIVCNDKQVDSVKSMCLRVLESESQLFEGLKIKVNCKISKTLA
jgi:hypothetical protein